MAHSPNQPSRMPAKTSALGNLWRLIAVLRVLLPQYRTLRRFGTGTVSESDGAPTRFAASLVALGPVFVKLGQS